MLRTTKPHLLPSLHPKFAALLPLNVRGHITKEVFNEPEGEGEQNILAALQQLSQGPAFSVSSILPL